MVKKDLQIKMGDRIRYLRRDLDLTQSELAKKLKCSTSYICEIEKGRRPVPTWFLYKSEKELGSIWADSF